MQANQGSIEQGQGRRDNGVMPEFMLIGASTRAARGAGTVWASSAFDLAQGLDVTVFELRMSIEDLDELFR